MSGEEGEDLKCDKEGYFDLDALKPYASVWVSTRRDAKGKVQSQEEDSDARKNVTPSRACNNLHSLLESNSGNLVGEPSVEEIKVSTTKSDHFHLAPYKLYEKGEGLSLRKISDKIIESMCKSEIKDESASVSQVDVKEALLQPALSDNEEEQVAESEPYEAAMKKQKRSDEEIVKDKVIREPSHPSHLGGGDPQEDKSKPKLLTENGKLVTEMNLAAINVKDQNGKVYPMSVKYVWETDAADIINAPDAFRASSSFLKLVESVSAVGIASDPSLPSTDQFVKSISWQDRSKSQSNCQPKRRLEVNENDSSHCVLANKTEVGLARKGFPLQARNNITRSKLSVAAINHDKRHFDNSPEEKRDERRYTDSFRDSKINIADRKSTLEKKSKVPVKRKNPLEELKGHQARPVTFNKRDLGPRIPHTRPPSAPTRETRMSHRIGVQESGDRLTAFSKRHFGKMQPPPPPPSPPSSRLWK